MSMRQICMLLVSAVLAVSVSCGGGGGSAPGPSQPPPTPNAAALPITAANAQDITAAVLQSITSTVDILSIVDVIGIPAISGASPGVVRAGVARATVGAVLPVTTDCDTGQVTANWNDADNNLQLSTGDAFDVVFDMCFDAFSGTTLDGASSLTNIDVSGDPIAQIAPWRLAITFGFDNLSAMDSAATAIIDGDLNLDLSSNDGVVLNLSVSTASLTVQQSGESETLSDYILAQTLDMNTLLQLINSHGTFTSTVLEGSVTFEALQDFEAIGDDYPSAGQLLTSDSRSSVLLTVLDNMNVQLDVDVDLNGTIDATIVVPWAELGID